MAMVSDVNSVTIAMDSSFLGVRNLLLLLIIIIIFVNCYCYYFLQFTLPAISPIWGKRKQLIISFLNLKYFFVTHDISYLQLVFYFQIKYTLQVGHCL